MIPFEIIIMVASTVSIGDNSFFQNASTISLRGTYKLFSGLFHKPSPALSFAILMASSFTDSFSYPVSI